MLKEVKSREELDLLLNEYKIRLYLAKNKPSDRRIFIKLSENGDEELKVQEVTEFIDNNSKYTFYSVDLDIFDYIIKNKLIDMKDISFKIVADDEIKKVINESHIIDIVEAYPKAIEFIDDEILDDLLYGSNVDLCEIACRSALELFTSKCLPKLNIGREEILKELNDDDDFCRGHKRYLEGVVLNSVIKEVSGSC